MTEGKRPAGDKNALGHGFGAAQLALAAGLKIRCADARTLKIRHSRRT